MIQAFQKVWSQIDQLRAPIIEACFVQEALAKVLAERLSSSDLTEGDRYILSLALLGPVAGSDLVLGYMRPRLLPYVKAIKSLKLAGNKGSYADPEYQGALTSLFEEEARVSEMLATDAKNALAKLVERGLLSKAENLYTATEDAIKLVG